MAAKENLSRVGYFSKSTHPPLLLTAPYVATLRERLLRNAVDNLLVLGPAAALTGPAARGDSALVARQGQAIQALDVDAGAAYAALSAMASRLARDRHL